MAIDIVRVVDNGVEFFTVLETGESGMSVSGLAKLCGVSQPAMSKTLKTLITKSPSRWLNSLVGKDLNLTTSGYKNGAKVRVLSSETCAAVLAHYAFSGHEKAAFAMQKFNRMGIDNWIQSITGWSQRAADTTRYLTGVVLIQPKGWERHYSEEWANEAVRLTGWQWEWSCMGQFINEAVYDWMPLEVRAELDIVNPRTATGKRKNKQHQHFADEASPVLKSHIAEALTLMRSSNSIPEFRELMNRRWKGRFQLRLNIAEAA
jgi:predicted transcriptional regulator